MFHCIWTVPGLLGFHGPEVMGGADTRSAAATARVYERRRLSLAFAVAPTSLLFFLEVPDWAFDEIRQVRR
jgi:hypothetical protein